MSADAISKGVREGWLVPDVDGWHRFVWDFHRDPLTNRWQRSPASGVRRVRVLDPHPDEVHPGRA